MFDDDHAPTVAQALRVTKLQLTPHAALAEIRKELAGCESEVATGMKVLAELGDALIAQNAQIRYEDRKLDRLVIQIAREKRATLTGAKPDEQPLFRRLFPSSPSAAMAGMPDAAQDAYVAIVQHGLGEPENAALAAKFAGPLAEQQAAVTMAVRTRAELEMREALASATLERALATARRRFNEAQLDAASIMKDEALVEGLFDFRPGRARKEKKSEAPPPG